LAKKLNKNAREYIKNKSNEESFSVITNDERKEWCKTIYTENSDS
jgi:hypothetical protein